LYYQQNIFLKHCTAPKQPYGINLITLTNADTLNVPKHLLLIDKLQLLLRNSELYLNVNNIINIINQYSIHWNALNSTLRWATSLTLIFFFFFLIFFLIMTLNKLNTPTYCIIYIKIKHKTLLSVFYLLHYILSGMKYNNNNWDYGRPTIERWPTVIIEIREFTFSYPIQIKKTTRWVWTCVVHLSFW